MTNNEICRVAFKEKLGWIEQIINLIEPRNKYTKNEIRIYDSGICEIDVYDSYGKYKDTGFFSKEDLDKIIPYKWYKDNTGYLSTTINGKKVRLHRFLFPDTLSDHINNNKMDNTRSNLQQITHALNIAKIPNKMKNTLGVTGIFITPSNTYQAYIEVNGKRHTKNYKIKEEAILQRYIWELNYWKKNAPQLEKICNEYPRLYNGMTKGFTISENIKLVSTILKRLDLDEHCPCQIEKNENTKCICKHFREEIEQGWCHCGLFFKIKENKDEEE